MNNQNEILKLEYVPRKTTGIYCVENVVNGKKYIGQSTDIKQRFYDHKSELRRRCHQNERLQLDWNEFGELNFMFYMVCECGVNELDELERYYISLFNSDNYVYGYNIEPGGRGGYFSTEETKKKISDHHADVSGNNNPFYGGLLTRGEGNGRCKITEKIAREIKQYFSDGHTPIRGEVTELARKYNISMRTVSGIKCNTLWRYLEV